jgi:hypothetical protein
MLLAALVIVGPQTVSIFGPDFSTALGRFTIVAGLLCLWPCAVALVQRRKLIFDFSKI